MVVHQYRRHPTLAAGKCGSRNDVAAGSARRHGQRPAGWAALHSACRAQRRRVAPEEEEETTATAARDESLRVGVGEDESETGAGFSRVHRRQPRRPWWRPLMVYTTVPSPSLRTGQEALGHARRRPAASLRWSDEGGEVLRGQHRGVVPRLLLLLPCWHPR